MKIIIVNDYAYVNGGAAKVALQSAIELATRGHSVEIFAGVGPPIPALRENGVRTTCLDQVPYNRDPQVFKAALRGIWNWQSARALVSLLRVCDPRDTIVHFHTFRDVLSTSVAYAAHRMGYIGIYTAHEYTLGCPYGGFFDYRRNQICKLRGLNTKCLGRHCNTGSYLKKIWNWGNQFIYARIARIPSLFQNILFVSRTSRSVLQPYIPPNQRIAFVPNPFDPMGCRAASIGSSSPFLYVGNLAPHKDPLTAARAAKKLGASIVFIGAGPLEEEIKQIYPGAEIAGWRDRDWIAKRMASARALVFPSIWYEAQPLTVMEAAASGLAVVASDASAAVELLELLGTGEVFPSGDSDALAAKMKPYLNDDYAREKGAAAFSAFNKQDSTIARHTDRLLEIYDAELALKKKGRLRL